MNRLHRERGQAHRNVLSAAFMGRGVAYPLAGVSDDGLSSLHVQGTAFVLDPKGSFQNNCELVELGGLSGFKPSVGTAHVSYAGGRRLRVDASDVFIDQFGFVASGLDAGRLGNQSRHGFGVGPFAEFIPNKSTAKALTAEFATTDAETLQATALRPLFYEHGYGVPGVGGVPGMIVGGPGMPSGPGGPGTTDGGVPGVPGV